MKTVDIRPGISVLSVLRHLNYRPWFALGEFVDNSVQSYTQNSASLSSLHGPDFRLRVSIDTDTSTKRITIRDNAAGIAESEYARAFRPAALPPDRSGLAEFGMGMKSAACWFAPRWTVRTKALGEHVSRAIHFDIAQIVNDDVSELSIQETPADSNTHFTEVILEDVFQMPAGRTVSKLKEHLTHIYRDFLRKDRLELLLNSERLRYVEPRILRAPPYKEPDGTVKYWHKPITFTLDGQRSVSGFAAIREKGDVAKAGFALFRRGRVIQGSADEGYRPAVIFGTANSFRYQRIFGELHLDGFEVSHTKDGFRWDDIEQPFLAKLKSELEDGDLPLLSQAEGYRARQPKKELTQSAARAVESTTRALERQLPSLLPGLSVEHAPPLNNEPPSLEVPVVTERLLTVRAKDVEWTVRIDITNDEAASSWLEIATSAEAQPASEALHIRLSAVHPFMVRFGQRDTQVFEALLRLGCAIAIAEVAARRAGVKNAGAIRRKVNDLLRGALSDPS